jgi:YegS/Rv2252/BmrU family lipid kinase
MASRLHSIGRRVMVNKQATIIYNPMSGRAGRRAENAARMTGLLGERGIDAEARATTEPEDGTRLAREATESGADIIVSYGGDGTLNEVLQGMAGSQTALAVWPGGTANVVARDLGIPFDAPGLADIIAAGKTNRIALGRATAGSGFRVQRSESESANASREPGTRNPEPGTISRYFLMMAGIGLDASIARGVNQKLKRRPGEFAFWVSGIKHFFRWRGEPFRIEVDGDCYESIFSLIGNGKGYGGRMMMTPGAKLEEPWFEIYILSPMSNNFAYLPALRACMRGKPEVAGATLIRGRHVEANSAHEPWVEADGEIIGPLPMTFDIVPDALSIIVP